MLIFGGEALSAELINKIRVYGSNCTVVNHYGPTETTIGKLLHIVKDGYPYQENIPVGKPFSNTKVYVVNASGQLCPVGVPGELLIGGDGVASGYLNNTELSAEKFINDPFSATSGTRFYRTGDTVKYLADGNILFIGRGDDQVKIRGYRIELGEIESALSGCTDYVHQAVVLARADDGGNKRLVGYIVPKGGFNKDAIVAYLKNRLPDYMIPLLFVELEKLPLTANGKVDKRALPEPDVNSLKANDYVAPRNETENTLIAIWQEVLRLDKIGVHDNFFELGGDSIITIQVVSRSRRSGYVLSPKDIFTCQTVARLSAQLAVQESNKVNAEQETLSGNSGLLPIQQKFLNSANPVKSFYNHHITYAIAKNVAIEALSGAIADLAGYHDAIRFAYQQTAAGWEQVYTAQVAVLEVVDLQKYDEEQFSSALAEQTAHYQESLDLEKGVLFRAVLFLSPLAEHQLLFVIHHLAVDGVSWRILSDDLELLLQHPGQPAIAVLGAKTSSYRQWYAALTAYGNSRGLQRQQDYWEQISGQYVPLRTDHKPEGLVSIADMDTAMVQLDSLTTGKLLHEISSVYHTEINDILLSALALTLSDWNKTSKVSIGLEGHGREEIAEDIDTSRTVGWFTTIYPVLLETGNDHGQLIKQVKETLRQIPGRGLGYGVLKYINQNIVLQANDPWDVQFNYLGQAGAGKVAGKLAHPKWETFGSAMGDQTPVSQPLSVAGIIQDNQLVLYWSYSNKHFNSESVEEMAAAYLKNLESLVNHCVADQQTTHYTPADFGLAGEVSIEELDQFLDEDFEGKPRRAEIESIYRLSGLQEGMLFHGIFDKQTSSSYVEQFSGELTDLDTDAFIQSWNYLLKQHSVLRSGFYANAFAIPVQCVYKEIEMPVTLVDYSGKTTKQQQKAINDYEKADLEKGFDFRQAPLMRIFLMKLGETKYHLCWTYHHILVDGWSMPVLMGELLKAYELLSAGKQLPIPAADRYEDYIRYIENRDADKGEDYWRNYLANVSEGTLLPFISATTERNKGIGIYSTHHLVLDAETTSRLSGYAQRHRITMNTLVQGVWAYLLYRYTGRTEVTYGVTVSGRPDNLPGVERAVGMYINTLPFRAQMNELQTVNLWLQAIQVEQLESREYQHIALNEIQRWAGIPGDLFDSLLVYENYPSNPITTASLTLQVDNVRKEEHTNYPLGVAVMVAEEITVYFSYNTSLLNEEYIEAIAGHFEQAILGMTSADNLLLKDIEILSVPEKQQLIHTFNATASAFPESNTIIDQFNAQVARTPNAPAFITDQVTMTYQELDQQAGRLANYLRDQGVGAETLVPLCLERSPEMVISIMAILKAGAAYVPIDPDYPQDRISFMLEDTAATIMISSSQCAGSLPADGLKVIQPDIEWEQINKYDTITQVALSPDNLAYVIYTSGSTGKPKGVLIEHRGVVSLALSQQHALYLTEGTRCLQFASFGFDASCYEVFNTLLSGGILILPKKEDLLSEDSVGAFVQRHDVEVVLLPPSYQHIVKDVLGPITTILSGGDALNRDDVRYIIATGVRVLNAYGPTENTVVTTLTDQPIQEDNVVVIGKPIANVQTYIRSENGQLCPVGVAGELCVGGVGVARGYLNRPELTAEKFIADPYSTQAGARLYRTGDLARFLPDGNIEYLGRIDDQVKVRGFRIELGEIESELQLCSLVNAAVVAVKPDLNGNSRLIGYIIPEGDFDKEAIIAYLKGKLPEHMVPGILLPIDKIPLTPNGKVDRKALPEPDNNALTTGNYVAPRNTLEENLALIWQDLLSISKVGVHDDFFELGGHSLLAMRVISALRKTLQAEIAVKTLFVNTTIAELAVYISQQAPHTVRTAIEKKTRPENIPLSFNQERLWFIDQLEGSIHYHIPAALRLKGQLNRVALEQAIRQLINRHEVLRTVMLEEDGKARQHVLAEYLWHLQVTDLIGKPTDSLHDDIRGLIMTPFDLAKDHMLRAHLILLDTDVSVLVLTMHHIASDGWSVSIVINELAAYYEAFTSGKTLQLPDLTIQYADFAIWQREQLTPVLLDKQLSYWKKQLSGTEPLQLPADFQRPAMQSKNAASYAFVIKPEILEQLHILSRKQDATLFMTLLAVFKVLLSRYSGQEDICIGTSIAGRVQQETENLIGFFVNTLALRSHTDMNVSFKKFIQQVKETTLDAYENQELPFEKVVEAVVKERDLSRTPLFQVMFELHNTPEMPDLSLGEVVVSQEDINTVTAQFDMTVNMLESNGELNGYITYCTDLYREATIERLSIHFETLLNAVISLPDSLLGELSMLTSTEEHQLLNVFNDTVTAYPHEQTAIDILKYRFKIPFFTCLVFENQFILIKN